MAIASTIVSTSTSSIVSNLNQSRDPVVREPFDLVRVSQHRVGPDVGSLAELLERVRKLAMRTARLQLQRVLEERVRETAAAGVERTLSPGRPLDVLLLLELDPPAWAAIVHDVAVNSTLFTKTDKRYCCSRIGSVWDADDL